MVATAETKLPHWDMTVVYPSLDSPEFEQGFSVLTGSIEELARLFDERKIEKSEPAPLDNETVSAFEAVVNRLNEVYKDTMTLGAYIRGFTTTNSRDNLAQAKLSELQNATVVLSKLSTRLTAWIGSLDVEELISRSQVAADHTYMLRKAKEQSRHLMSPAEEELAAELNPSAGTAWSKLHGNVTSQLAVQVELNGERQTLPMPSVRNLAFAEDREARRQGYEAEVEAWKTVQVPLAQALNSIKGEVNTLTKRRGWGSALDEAIFNANIDRQTLDAMMQAAHESFPEFRRYLKAKARALGLEKLTWYDMFAPLGKGNRVWEYQDAADFIVEQFGTYSEKMSKFARRAFDENWIDAEPRSGKRDGAFCMWLRGEESRILSNYKPAYGGMSTLAHELGHGYHNLVKAHRTMLQKTTPMTLAETASIFCETIVRNAALKHADADEQLSILEASLQDSTQVVVDITSRFLFESRVFEMRKQRELSVDEFCDLMLQAQRETYGDGLDENTLHPYMWAVKGHYYSTGLSFYNFPYMFGLLFGLGLYAQFQQDADTFRTGYDDLLSSTGMDDAATLAARFGIDIRTPDFWRSSLAIIREDIDRFESLV
ncbi:MAG: M3 family oligoendopeptidase [Chloroflexota bacterium]|nr:M3 family oligoendopeptidase [Chloroflexota bacterium]MDQ5864905.1 M3 family oligoendopeptidase [Chloroflexota bacterium]